jgi:uncharacterized protein (TIGR03382 family)
MRHVLFLRTTTLLGLLAPPAIALAQPPQLVAFDVVYTAEKYDGTVKGENFHHLVLPSPTEPASWTSPVDYSKGTVYFHQEVMTKPSARPTWITVCFDGDLEAYGCIETAPYTATGVHDSMKPLSSAWQYGKIQWSKRRTQYHLAIKDSDRDAFPTTATEKDFVPSKMRLVMTIVPPGGKYTPPAPLSGGEGTDGGATPVDASEARPDAAPTVADAGTTTPAPDAGTSAPGTTPDAATSTPATKVDAASKPPKPEPEPEDPGTGGSDNGGARPASKSGGCSVAGGGSAAGPLLLLALALIQRRRRSR